MVSNYWLIDIHFCAKREIFRLSCNWQLILEKNVHLME